MANVFTIRGLDQVQRRLAAVASQVEGQVGAALRAEAEIEMTEAKKRTPVDTGALRGSGHVTGPHVAVVSGTPSGRNLMGQFQSAGARSFGGQQVVSVTMAFGGPAAPYATKVHEDLEAFHRNGQAKFLESVLLESAPYLAQRVARRIRLGQASGGSVAQPRDSRGRFMSRG